jgi:hypothetical protein
VERAEAFTLTLVALERLLWELDPSRMLSAEQSAAEKKQAR